MRGLDLTGQRFGRLLVLECCGRSNDGQKVYRCKCDCGSEKEIRSGNLRNGTSKSCGCLSAEMTSKRNKETSTIHGGCGTRLYRIWIDMRQRCTWGKAINWHLYGGRGIKVCEEWQNDFSAFKEWAENNGYSDDLQLDRIDNDGNYEPSNCKWSTRSEQGNNRRTCVYITIDGETKTLTEWCNINGVSRRAAYCRIRAGWDGEDAVTVKEKPKQRLTEDDVRFIKTNYVAGSKEYGVQAMATRFDVSKSTIESILQNRNWKWVK